VLWNSLRVCLRLAGAFCVSSPEVLIECLLGRSQVDGVGLVYPGHPEPRGVDASRISGEK